MDEKKAMNICMYDLTAQIDKDLVLEAQEKTKQQTNKHPLIKWLAIAACFCIVIFASFNTLQRFDYFKGSGCSAMPGTIVDSSYYYKIDHSGVWKYADGVNEKVLNTYWEDGNWLVNKFGLYYSYGKAIYRMDLESLERSRIFSASEGTHIGFELTTDGNVIVSVYDKSEKFRYQILINGKSGELIEQLTEKTSYDSDTQMYSKLNLQIGERKIELVRTGGDKTDPHYMPVENGEPLLSDGYRVSPYGYENADGVLYFDVLTDEEPTEESRKTLILFSDGKTILESGYNTYSGAVGHILLYVDFDNTENYGSNGNGIWCYDTDSGERWQLTIDAESEFYEFTNDNQLLYSCVPWSEKQTAWEIVFESNKPVALHLIDSNIIE